MERFKYDGMMRSSAEGLRWLIDAQLHNVSVHDDDQGAEQEEITRREEAAVQLALDNFTGIMTTLEQRHSVLRAAVYRYDRKAQAELKRETQSSSSAPALEGKTDGQ